MKDIDTEKCSLKKRYMYMHKCINMYQQKTGVQTLHAQGTLFLLSVEQKKGGANILGGGILGEFSPNTFFSPLSILTLALRRRASHKSSTSIIRREEQDGLPRFILW